MSSLWSEIQRRNVGRVTVAYVVVAWLLAQVAQFASETFGAPPWVLQVFVVFLMLGLPVAVLLAWAYDLTPEGIRITPNADDQAVESPSPKPQRRNVFAVLLAVGMAIAAWLQFYGPEPVRLKHEVATASSNNGNGGKSLHFELAFPDDALLAVIGAAELGIGSQAFAISPHGQLVVYAGASSEGYQLYLRDLATHETVPLKGTSGAFGPFFSPDSAWIGYFVGNELYKVSASGGEPLFLAEATNSRGAIWDDSDHILLTLEEGAEFARVSAIGGEPERLDVPVERRLRNPSAIRGENKVFADGGIIDLETMVFKSLPMASGDMRYHNGYLFYSSQNSLFAARFDLATEQPSSVAVPVITGLRSEIWGDAQWSVSDDGTLLYLAGAEASSSPLRWVSSTHNEAVDLPMRARGTLEISPDGKRIAVAETLGNDRDIWVYDLQRSRATKLTTDGLNSGPLFWAPDGDSVYYQKDVNAQRETNRGFIDSERPGELVLGEASPLYSATSITADGRFLGIQGQPGIGIYDVVQKKVTAVPTATTRDWGSALSPDGSAIVYTSSISGAYHVYLQPIPTTGERYQVSDWDGSEEPRWSADGKKIYYRNGSSIVVVDVQLEPKVNLGASQDFYVGTFENVGGRSYAIDPDGERALVIGSEDLKSSIRVITNWFAYVERLIQAGEAHPN